MTDDAIRELDKKDHKTLTALKKWWESLEDDRGSRARLKRAEKPEDALLTEAFFGFLHRMPEAWHTPEQLLCSASVACVLAHLRTDAAPKSRIKAKHARDKTAGFAEQLATPAEGGAKPVMSDLRFQRLVKSRTTEEFFYRMVQAVRLLRNKANIISVTDAIIRWHYEYRHGARRTPQNRLAVRWAGDYYATVATIKS